MLKLAHEKDLTGLDIPDEILLVIKSYLHILDTTYGADRDTGNSDGGYVILL